jgi:hypothetical protein
MRLYADDFFISNFPSEYAETFKPVWRKKHAQENKKNHSFYKIFLVNKGKTEGRLS